MAEMERCGGKKRIWWQIGVGHFVNFSDKMLAWAFAAIFFCVVGKVVFLRWLCVLATLPCQLG
jgi:hypothetical protein